MIISNHRPDDLTEEEGCAYDLAAELCAGGVLPNLLHQQSLRLLGQHASPEG